MSDTTRSKLLTLCRRLLDSIDHQDWDIYTELCDPTLTSFEPEAVGHLVSGISFHQFYFKLEGGGRSQQSTICSPEIRLLGDVAIVTYVRLTQHVEEDGHCSTTACEETRIWQLQNAKWRHVHFHRSQTGHVRL